MEYAFIQVDDIVERLLVSDYDSIVYKSLLERFHSKDDAKIHLKEYNSSRRSSKTELLYQAAKHLKGKGLEKYRNYEAYDILCDEIAETVTVPKWFNRIFGHTDSEDNLYPHVRRYLKRQYERVFETFDMKGEKWPDFFAIKKKMLGGVDLVAIEAKAKYNEYKRFLNQARSFLRYSDKVFLAATPGFVVEVGQGVKGKPAYGANILEEELKKDNIGLLVIDMTAEKVKECFGAGGSDFLSREEKERTLRKLGV